MVTRIKIGTNVIAGDFSAKRLLKRDNPLGRDGFSMQPHGDMRLADGTVCNFTQALGESGLTAGFGNRFTEFGDCTGHEVHHNTDSVMLVNTRSVSESRQNSGMPKPEKETDFWKRLTMARTTCSPPKSMLQRVLVKEYPEFASHQSTVTKWKTGGENGSTQPRPEVVRKLAADTGVNFNWLFSGEGEMRSRPTPDSITEQILEAINSLTLEGKIEVLKSAIAQQTLQLPAVLARIQEAQRKAESVTKREVLKKKRIGKV